MSKEKVQRKVADKTRIKILKAASKLFAEKGFSGTSTQSIAKAAKVNETLIFHHFGTKSQLWKMVKAHVVESISLSPLDSEPKSLRVFLEMIFKQYLDAFAQQPDLGRLLQWQYMEAEQSKLIAGNPLAPTNWLGPIQYLQQINQIKADMDASFIIIWLTASLNIIIFDHRHIFQNKATRDTFIENLLAGFERALGNAKKECEQTKTQTPQQ
ncbi:TetR/AcrR family transcriptional regulator [Legionella drozanskii]|uniref:HTH-type transcriptional repressor NicS n=1 Tax=Legionella drozanskii LLAP-1 TaxID=1212489 RepID=A0A0W0SWG0_9GAMM|nr:TetR/AcrR family transcriptional regulator [Legionella drozanskii]KTC87703.1 HTH-type transcriptional repressor NicS [Legionella drozanskii LLAP-1]